jgi:peptidoglycan/xylan/chitin deacetylase (PgdA/CDA1 family)
MKRRLAAKILDWSGARALMARWWAPGGVVCLNYHRLCQGAPDVGDPGVVSTDPSGFDAQMAFLARNCDVIVPADLPAARRDRRGRFALVTFDDGYRDNHDVAFPILRRHGLRATFFVATGFIDRPRLPWWDEIAAAAPHLDAGRLDLGEFGTLEVEPSPGGAALRVRLLALYKSLPAGRAALLLARLRVMLPADALPSAAGLWMDWNMLREMAAAGMVIGGHTVDHPVLSRLPPEGQREQIAVCARRLREELGVPMDCFAYPVGGRDSFDEATRAALRDAGVRFAFSYYGGFAGHERVDDLDIVREPVAPSVDPSTFRALVSLPRLFCRA